MSNEKELLNWFSIYAKYTDQNSPTGNQIDVSLFHSFDFEKFTASKINIFESTVIEFLNQANPNVRPINITLLSVGYLGKMTREEFMS